MRNNITDIYCIGTQKAGTSWMHTMLNIHPKTFSFKHIKNITSTNKEAHFWDWNQNRGIDWYREIMNPRSKDKLSMDFTPEYSLLKPKQIRQCYNNSPNAYVFYILRSPIDRAISCLKMFYLWEFGKDDSINIEMDKKFRKILYKSKALHTSMSYYQCIDNWSKHYSDIKILDYRDILEHPECLVRKTYSEIGLSFNDMGKDERLEFTRKINKRVWESHKFNVSEDVIDYMNSALNIYEHEYLELTNGCRLNDC